jgi:hypothetical protein
MVHQLGFGSDGFWSPKKVTFNVVKGFKITEMEKHEKGIRIEMSRTLGVREKSALAGLRIVKSLYFNPRGVSVQSVLTNTATVPVRFAFRFHNIPTHLASAKGRVLFGNASFVREQSLKIVRFGKADDEIDKLFKVDQFISAPVKEFKLHAPGLTDMKVSLGGAAPYGVIFWDGGTFSTMEPIFNTVELAPGAGKAFRINFSF